MSYVSVFTQVLPGNIQVSTNEFHSLFNTGFTIRQPQIFLVLLKVVY